MNKAIILLSIDGLGMGSIEENRNFNTWQTILNKTDEDELVFLKSIMHNAQKLFLDYPGADSYLGHLTMSGINVNDIQLHPLNYYLQEMTAALENDGYHLKNDDGILVIENKFVIYDNFEADHGLAINILASFDQISFDEIKKIAATIRDIIKNPRLICFGAFNIEIEQVLKERIDHQKFHGINTPATGVYNNTFLVKHFPFIKSFDTSIQAYALKQKWKIALYGKFSDIINLSHDNADHFKSIDITDIFHKLKSRSNSLQIIHFVNIQQTDLAGHQGDVKKYVSALKLIEAGLLELINHTDYKIILTSDHGNDPAIKDGKHTREWVPLWTYNINTKDKLENISEIFDLIKIAMAS